MIARFIVEYITDGVMSPAVVRVIQGALGDGVVVAAAACRLPRAVATSVFRIGGARIVSVERAAARADGGVSGCFVPERAHEAYGRMCACGSVADLSLSHADCEWRLTASGLSARVRPFGGHIALLVVSDDHQSMRRQAFANPSAA